MKPSRVVALIALVSLFGCMQLLPPGFPHRAHLTEERCGGPGQPPCPTCASCHDGVRRDLEEGPPTETLCRGCHGERASAVMAAVRRGSQKRTEITFSHASHLARDDFRGQCVRCHAGVTSDGVEGDVYPAMATCLDCHTDGLREDQCGTCHQPPDLRRLVPETFLRHDVGFFRNHGIAATQHENVCTQCHTEGSSCARCHDQSQPIGLHEVFPDAIERSLIHRADFVVRHAIEARSQRAECVRCHTPSFCDSCHVQRGVSGNRAGSLNPHPIGWVGPDPDAPTFHGRAARRDIVSCAGCHDAGPATNCIRCHSVGQSGGNPHPSGWRSARSPDAPMCRYCHVP